MAGGARIAIVACGQLYKYARRRLPKQKHSRPPMNKPANDEPSNSAQEPSLMPALGQDVYREMLEGAPDGMVMIDAEGRIVLVNRQVEVLFRYSREQLLGQPIEILLPSRYGHGHVAKRKEYFVQPQTRGMGTGRELFAQRSDGTEFPVEVSLSPMQTPLGPMVLSAIRDVTEAAQAREIVQFVSDQLRARNKALEQFTFLASHDLQEPLRTIESFSGLLRTELGEGLAESSYQALQYIEESAQRMSRLLRELLEHSRLGHMSAFDPVDTEELVREVLQDLHAAVAESSAEVQVAELPRINGQRAELQLLFQNLISNAIKYRRKDVQPIIHVDAIRRDNGWEFRVDDNSIGIDPALADKIFLPFKRLHRREEYAGTGMGLAHCAKIVELHGGRIWVTPNEWGGSAFRVFLPHVRPELTVPAPGPTENT